MYIKLLRTGEKEYKGYLASVPDQDIEMHAEIDESILPGLSRSGLYLVNMNTLSEDGGLSTSTPVSVQQHIILRELAELDKVITRPVEQMYIDAGIEMTVPKYINAVAKKEEYRELLISLG